MNNTISIAFFEWSVKFVLFILLLVMSSLSNQISCQNIREGNDYALFFAIDNYLDKKNWNNLKNPIIDSEEIADLLKEYYDFKISIYRNSTLTEIEAILANWQKKEFNKNDQLFIFFSGHGFFNEFNKKGYFVPKDGKERNYRTFIELGDIANIVTQIPCDHILLAIDACYSGTIDQSIAFRSTPTFRRPGNDKSIQSKNYIEKQLAFKSRLLITSGGKERTPDGKNHSPFSEAIIRGLRKTYADISYAGVFSFQDLIARLSRVKPIPHYGDLPGHEDGGFVFVTNNWETHFATESISKPNTVKDREGNSYEFKEMQDGKIWMIDNLTINVEGSYCYEGLAVNCEDYGRFYTWTVAENECKQLGNGWRLPSEFDFMNLCSAYGVKYVGTSRELGETENAKVLTPSGSSGFNLLLLNKFYSGYYNQDGFSDIYDSRFWTSNFDANGGPVPFGFAINGFGRCHGEIKSNGYAVRCIKDE